MNPITRIACGTMKKEYEKMGIDTSEPVDRRGCDSIRRRATEVEMEQYKL